jgi:hypothetical protein
MEVALLLLPLLLLPLLLLPLLLLLLLLPLLLPPLLLLLRPLLLVPADRDDDATPPSVLRFFAPCVEEAYIESMSLNFRLAASPVGLGTMFRPVSDTNAQ